MVQALGVHYLLELKECDPRPLDDLAAIKQILLEAVQRSRATIVDTVFHRIRPRGVAGTVLLTESHLAIHTWPEHAYAAVDIYTSGRLDVITAVGSLIERLRSRNPVFVMIRRGLTPAPAENAPIPLGHSRVDDGHDPNAASEWFFLDFVNPSSATLLKARRLIFAARSPYQEIEILDTEAFGKCLILDGHIQSAQVDEFVYHEALVHPVMITHPNPQRVLIIGGGEGATLREVLRHRTVQHVVMVDIDEQVVEACRLFLPEWSDGAFDDPRAEVVIDDARRYLQATDDRFDVIIMDITEAVEDTPSVGLVTQEMFQILRAHLNPGGIVVNQSGSTGLSELQYFASIHKTMRTVFAHVAPYSIQITSFSSPWGLITGSDALDPRSLTPEEVDRRLHDRVRTPPLRFYDGSVHRAMFTLPRYLYEILERTGQVIHDDGPPVYRTLDYTMSIG